MGRNWALGLRLDPGRLVGKGIQSFYRSETTQPGHMPRYIEGESNQ